MDCPLSLLPLSPFLTPLKVHNLQLATVGNHDLLRGRSGVGSNCFDPLDDVHALDDTAEDDVLAV